MQENYYDQIKEQLINNEAYKKIKNYSKNKNDLITYYNVGKLIIETQGGEIRAKYGNKLIKEYSKRLSQELGKGYGIASLKNMRSFYLFCKKGYAMDSQLSWMHYRTLLPLDNLNEIKYYLGLVKKHNLGYRELKERIKSKEYEILSIKTKNKLDKNENIEIQDFIKNPIIINSNGKEIINEKMLHQLILENIENFLSELGDGFTFIKSEYPIKIGNNYNYIDLLLFNYIYNCFVVIELKVTELKKEHLGQIGVYMNYIDENIKSINQNETIGIIICKEDNKLILKYCSDDRIFSTKYITI